MKKWLSKIYVQYALLSIAFPIVTMIVVHSLIYLIDLEFWNSIEKHPDPDNGYAAALVILDEMIYVIFATGVASAVGFVIAILGIKQQRRVWGIGLVALIFNSLPLLLFLFFFGRAWIRGGY